MVNELAVIDALVITHNESGDVVINNYEVVRDTLKSMLEGQDKVIIGEDESSVRSGQYYCRDFNEKIKAIKKVFEDEEIRIKKMRDDVVNPKKELIGMMEDAKEDISKQVIKVKKKWKEQIVFDLQRESSIDLDIKMFDDVKINVNTTREYIEKHVSKKIDELEKEYKQKLEDEEMLKDFCEQADEMFDVWKWYLEKNTLKDVIKLIQEKKAEEKQRKAEFKKIEEAKREVENMDDLQEIVEIPEVLEVPFVEMVEDVVFDEEIFEDVVFEDVVFDEEVFGEEIFEEKVIAEFKGNANDLIKLREFCEMNNVQVLKWNTMR